LEYTKRALKETNNETHCIRAITTNKTMRRLRHGSGDQAEESGSQDPEEVHIEVVRIKCWLSDISNFILTLSFVFSPMMTSNR
jgi:hypothetical protein